MPLTKEELRKALKNCWGSLSAPATSVVVENLEVLGDQSIDVFDILAVFEWDEEAFLNSLLKELNKQKEADFHS
jgi:hypothetical protein